MLYRRAFSLLVLSLAATVALGAEPSQGDLFEKGLAAYQSKQYAEARDAFQKELDQGNENPAVLNNLALAAFQLDQKPLALALWRKALFLRPGFKPAVHGRDYLEKKMNMRPLERDSFNLWLHRNLESLSGYELLWLTAFLLVITGWFGFRYWGERRFALEEEQPMPPFPTLTIVFALFLLAMVAISTLKLQDGLTKRATITAAKASVRSLPADEGVDLLDLSGGTEVYVRQAQQGWMQVQNVDGTSGWVKGNELLITSER